MQSVKPRCVATKCGSTPTYSTSREALYTLRSVPKYRATHGKGLQKFPRVMVNLILKWFETRQYLRERRIEVGRSKTHQTSAILLAKGLVLRNKPPPIHKAHTAKLNAQTVCNLTSNQTLWFESTFCALII